MIVREVLGTPSLIDTLDLFNDAVDTLCWLRALEPETELAKPLADRLEGRLTIARSREARGSD
jgi:hypothetical protein